MKRPISVTVAGVIYLVLTFLIVLSFALTAVYSGEELIRNMISAYPFLPWWLSMAVSLVLTVLPVFIAVGIFSGSNAARWLAVFSASISVVIVLNEPETYGPQKLAFQIVLHCIILFCLFNPAARRYFAQSRRNGGDGRLPE